MGIISIFRIVLVTGIVTALICVAISFGLSDTLPPILQDYLAQLDSEELADGEFILLLLGVIVALILSIVVTIGIWMFKRWARTLYIAIIVISFPMYIVMGPVVMTAWEAMFADMSLILDGILIAMMYTGSIGKIFNQDHSETEVEVFQ